MPSVLLVKLVCPVKGLDADAGGPYVLGSPVILAKHIVVAVLLCIGILVGVAICVCGLFHSPPPSLHTHAQISYRFVKHSLGKSLIGKALIYSVIHTSLVLFILVHRLATETTPNAVDADAQLNENALDRG